RLSADGAGASVIAFIVGLWPVPRKRRSHGPGRRPTYPASHQRGDASMIKAGDKLPDVQFNVPTSDGMKKMRTAEIFGGKTVAPCGVRGAFTPTCSARHLPSFRENADAIKAKGVDTIACTAVNDHFVMNAWAKDQGVQEQITMLADGSGDFA